ncbi:LAME_0F18272g1_1 [Lachancea meyersii CBS 8951]|uniref:U1 small nuclear ribonucleoprotein component SNU71 n=1 Tax=Lachancea meyersii CBS 8951 TaxID=1266667 RepID=A0A1G4K0H8_9SACH|nr:LAME_0F18272g1_1 [Lachancea meyersii CBS 8951]
MSSMVYVCPSAYLAFQKQWHSDTFKPGFIPILRTDLLRFRDALDKVVSTVNQQKAAHAYLTSDQKEQNSAGKEVTNDQEAISENGSSSLHKYQDLKQFLPITLKQQLCTVSIDGLPGALTQTQIAKFVKHLESITAKALDAPTTLHCWSYLKGLDTMALFLRCDDCTQLPLVVSCWNRLFSRWAEMNDSVKPVLHYDENTTQFLKDHGQQTIQMETPETDEHITALINLIQNLQDSDAQSKDENLSVDYKVDVSTLSDLPHTSLDQLCKDIVHFRTRVVTIEKEKRAKAEYEENRRMGQHMKNVFEQIRKSKGDPKLMEDEEDLDNQGGGDDDDEAGDEEDDLVVEQRKQEKSKLEADRLFKELLDRHATKIEPHLHMLRQQLVREQTYESTLEQERSLYLKELLHLAYSPYYDHHRSYKDEEIRRDEEDRKMYRAAEPLVEQKPEKEETPFTAEPSKFKLQISKPKEEATKLSQSGEELETVLQELRDSGLIRELATEFLGEPDDDLEEFILDHLKEHASKPELLSELRETFDEDADVIVDRIWEKLETFSGEGV